MADVVLDASAVLAVLNGEPGADEVSVHLPGAHLSAVNAAEVAGKLVDGGAGAEAAGRSLDRLGVRIVPFERDDVVPVADIRAESRSAGLSLGDRACLALARRLDLPALTADRQWKDIQVGVEVRLIRGD
ncbi:MAG: type II toxin-antitoxin system VapC family toxin [Rhodospirillales bacterium]|nr:type II toxin-antitoxin system VapC family toxin [Rhodospirillales bacterium]MDH3793132.1 type II toxin-antitoxin system VapC family toxin [Rhodospirillales bacterium]MDH3911953.1 type II toxin-antitoxin system VapC family toxin [Rhodospirillales bacterium]MDH3967638.1 type II toxin-antitoxin system VapC family toxin [Rhodospirillales bacterium]